MIKEKRSKLINICLFLLVLLIAQEAILLVFDRKDSMTAKLQKKWTYSSAIDQGLKFYTPQNLEKLRIDEYLLLREISLRENKVGLSDLNNKYEGDPFRRIFNKENYEPNVYFDRSGFG